MTDALETFRAQMDAMTPGPLPKPELRHGMEWYDIGDVARIFGFDDAVGFVSAVRLAQYLVGDEVRGAFARMFDPESFKYRALPLDGFHIIASLHDACDRDIEISFFKADAVLSLLAQVATQQLPSAQEDAG